VPNPPAIRALRIVGIELSNLTSLAGYNEDPINTSIGGVTNGGLLLEAYGACYWLKWWVV